MEQRTVYTWAMGTFGLHAIRSHQNMGGSTWPTGYAPASYGLSVEVATPPGSVHTSYTILGSNMSNARVPPAELWCVKSSLVKSSQGKGSSAAVQISHIICDPWTLACIMMAVDMCPFAVQFALIDHVCRG